MCRRQWHHCFLFCKFFVSSSLSLSPGLDVCDCVITGFYKVVLGFWLLPTVFFLLLHDSVKSEAMMLYNRQCHQDCLSPTGNKSVFIFVFRSLVSPIWMELNTGIRVCHTFSWPLAIWCTAVVVRVVDAFWKVCDKRIFWQKDRDNCIISCKMGGLLTHGITSTHNRFLGFWIYT